LFAQTLPVLGNFTHTHIHTNTHIHTHQHTPTHTNTHIHTQIHTQTHTHTHNVKNGKQLNKTSQTRAEFLLAGMKAQLSGGGGRILLGDNTGAGAVMLRPIRFQCDGFWILPVLLSTNIYSWPCVYSITTCAKFDLRRTFRRVTVFIQSVLNIVVDDNSVSGLDCS
jgi:hypothetical protein